VIHVPFFFIPLVGGLLLGGTLGLGAGAAVGYYYAKPGYYPYPVASYPYQYAAPPAPARVCPHCGAPF